MKTNTKTRHAIRHAIQTKELVIEFINTETLLSFNEERMALYPDPQVPNVWAAVSKATGVVLLIIYHTDEKNFHNWDFEADEEAVYSEGFLSP